MLKNLFLVFLFLFALASIQAVTVNATYVVYNDSLDSIMYDNVTGKFHGKTWGEANCTAISFANATTLASNSPYHTGGIGNNSSYNTNFEANNGKIFGQYGGYNSYTIGRWNAETKALEATTTFPNTDGTNYFNWTSATNVNVFFDGLNLYALTGDSLSTSWRLTKFDQNLNALGSQVFADSSMGHAFMMNGKLFTSNSYDNFLFNQVLDFTTGSYTAVNYQLSPNMNEGAAGGNYITDSAYNASQDALYFSRWGYIYRVDNASVAFNAPAGTPVPEPGTWACLLISGAVICFLRRNKEK